MSSEIKKTIGIIGPLPPHFDLERFRSEHHLVITLGVLTPEALAALILSENFDEFLVVQPDTSLEAFLLECSLPIITITASQLTSTPLEVLPISRN